MLVCPNAEEVHGQRKVVTPEVDHPSALSQPQECDVKAQEKTEKMTRVSRLSLILLNN